MTPLVRFAAAAMLSTLGGAFSMSSQAAPGEPTYAVPQLRLEARATERAKADRATLYFLVRASHAAPAEAAAELERKTKAFSDKLVAAGVPVEALRWSEAYLTRSGGDSDSLSRMVGRSGPGFEARRRLAATVTRMELLPALSPRVAEAMVEEYQGVVFSRADEATLRESAQAKATQELLRRSATLATQGGARLGRLLNVAVQGRRDVEAPPVKRKGASSPYEAEPRLYWPLEPEEVEIEAVVSGLWELEKPAP